MSQHHSSGSNPDGMKKHLVISNRLRFYLSQMSKSTFGLVTMQDILYAHMVWVGRYRDYCGIVMPERLSLLRSSICCLMLKNVLLISFCLVSNSSLSAFKVDFCALAKLICVVKLFIFFVIASFSSLIGMLNASLSL